MVEHEGDKGWLYCNAIRVPIQWLTHIKGSKYVQTIVHMPYRCSRAYSTTAIAEIARSEMIMFQNSLGRKRELSGRKWLLSHQPLDFFGELLGPAVMWVMRYHGQPANCWNKILRSTTIGASSIMWSRSIRPRNNF